MKPRPTVGIISLGCAKNQVDSQMMADWLRADGFELAQAGKNADILLVNTCAFIESARQESDEAIREACDMKRKGRAMAVIVAGCLPQRYAGRIRIGYPDVDAFVGIDAADRIARIARAALSGRKAGQVADIPERPCRVFEKTGSGVVFSTGAYAYLKIADGCGRRCAFCAIPEIRGPLRSRSVSSLAREAQELINRGFREITLVAQDVTSFGRDKGEKRGLEKLLRTLDSLDGCFWIRVMYAHPAGVTVSLLETMASLKHVVRYLDVPIQHADPDVLARMGRANTAQDVISLPDRARRAMPDMALRTTCLVGHPGEDEKAFERLMDFVKIARFDHLGVFAYSPEEGTASASLPDRPPPEIAVERRNRLLALQTAIVREKQETLVNTGAVVLLERQDRSRRGTWLGRSFREAPEVDGWVRVSRTGPRAGPGDFTKVLYTGFEGCDMLAESTDRGD